MAGVRIGIIGVGRMGGYHLKKLAKSPRAELVGVYDPEPRRQQWASDQGVQPSESVESLLFEADAVIIASPTPTHCPLTLKALDAGVHVLVEKPMADSVDQARKMVTAAADKGLVLQVGHLERFRLGALLEPFDLDRPYYVETQRLTPDPSREDSIDVVSDLMIHDVDLVLSLIKKDPEYISAIGLPVRSDHFDIANVRMEFSDGAVANLNASRVSSKKERRIRIFSTSSYASLDMMGNHVAVAKSDGKGSWSNHSEHLKTDILELQCEQFLSCVRGEAQPVVSAEDGLRAIKYSKLALEKLEDRVLQIYGQGKYAQPTKENINRSW